MSSLRILLILIAILICCLLILPKHPKEKLLEQKILKIIVLICILLSITIGISLYYFRYTLWKEQDNTALIIKKIQNHDQIKTLTLTNYDLQNFDPATIVTVLNQQPKIGTLAITELTTSNIFKLQYILAESSTIKTLIINHTDNKTISSIIDLLVANKNINSFLLNRNELTADVLVQLINVLKNNKTINTIGLNYDNLSDDELPQILDLLTTQIVNLSLQGHQFSSHGLEILAKALSQNKTLRVLTISTGMPAASNKKLLLDAISDPQLKINFGN